MNQTTLNHTNGSTRHASPAPGPSNGLPTARSTESEDTMIQTPDITHGEQALSSPALSTLFDEIDQFMAQQDSPPAPLPAASQATETAASVRLRRPVLIIGVGGTGCKVATHLKAQLLDIYGQLPTNLCLVALDSAEDPITARSHRLGKVVKLEKDSEFYLFEKVPVVGIKRKPQRHPIYLGRLGDNIHHLKRAYIKDGAEQMRLAGLLALLWNSPQVERALYNALHRLTKQHKELHTDLEQDHSIQVFIVGSTAGGQGSGAMLDIAQLVREKLLALGNLGEGSSVVGLLLQPSAFYEKENLQMQANAMAFTRELNELMVGQHKFTTLYPTGTTITWAEQPFDHVLIFEGINEHGQSWAGTDAICELMAQTLALFAGSPIGMREIGTMVNQRGVLHNITEGGFGTYLATAGVAMIRFPRRELAQRCAIRQAVGICDHFLTSGRAETHAASQPSTSGFLIDLAALRDLLSRTPQGAALYVRIAPPAGFDQGAIEELPAQARLLVDNYTQRRLYAGLFAQITENGTTLQEQTQQALETELHRLLAEGRLAQAYTWLRQHQTLIQSHRASVVEQLARSAHQVEQGRSATDSLSAALDRIGDGFFHWLPALWRNQMRGAVQSYLEAASRLAEARLEARLTEELHALLLHLERWLQQKLQLLEQLTRCLREARSRLTTLAATLAQEPQTPNEIVLADTRLVEHFYQTYAYADAVAAQMALAAHGGLAAWAEQRSDQVAQALVQSALAPFAPLLQLSVEEILLQHYQERSPHHWIARLTQLAGGAWNPDRALLQHGNGDLATYLTIGVPDETTSLFNDTGHTLVSLHDPERIVVLRTLYGCSFDALKAFDLWQRAYTKVSAKHPVHILPDFQQDDERVQQHFALGLIYGHIEKQGTWYYYKPEDVLKVPVQLGQGLENALVAFGRQPALQQELAKRVQLQITADGLDQTIARLDAWLLRHSKQNDDLTKRLCYALRNYLATLQANR
jgi:hypothetical protein